MFTIGFIGLGHMGGPMAANLIKAGHQVKGFDLNKVALEASAQDGVQVVASAAEAVVDTDVVITMLPKGEHSIAAYSGDDGIFKHASTKTLLIDSSTIDVESCQILHNEAKQNGFRFIDAPVSGGTSGAESATLTFMVGGDPADVAEAESYLQPMAGNIIPTGGPTTGQAAKICNNLMLFINLVSTCEGSILADHLGLDPNVFWNIARVSSGNSWALEKWSPLPGVVDSSAVNHDFEATFSMALAHKDLNLALAAGELTDTPLPLAHQVASMFQKVMDADMGHLDCTVVSQLISGKLNKSSGTQG